jgi:hypothetical protein
MASDGKQKAQKLKILEEKAMLRAINADGKAGNGKRHNSEHGPTHPFHGRE